MSNSGLVFANAIKVNYITKALKCLMSLIPNIVANDYY